MKIQSVEITNDKAFLGTYTLTLGGNNVFMYGEIRAELTAAIQTIKNLKTALAP